MPFFEYQGRKIYYRLAGKGELMIILPGNTASSACHLGEIEYYKENYKVVSPDYLGTGKSDRLEDWKGEEWFEESARQVIALIKHLKADKAILMGTSGGASIALLAAILAPESVKAVIADSTSILFTEKMLSENVIKERKAPGCGLLAFWLNANGPDWEEVVDADTAMLTKCVNNGGDLFKGRLSEIECPVLITAGKEDQTMENVEAELESFKKQIPDCHLYLHSSGDHPFMWTEMEAFRTNADLFLNKL